MLTLPHYQILTQIYESANSFIYRGLRRTDNLPVILKALKEDYPNPEELTRYRQEFEIAKDLNLEGVLKAYAIEKYQNTLVIILEDFGGESLKAVMHTEEKWGGRNISLSNFLKLAIQIADSLGHIHAANIIHKDINPANIVWNQETKQIKIIDFGIATVLPRENLMLKNPSLLEGTLAYISPEQTGRMNRALDYRTDLYSLGVTFYELLTGKIPFESDNPLKLVHCHIAKIPTPVQDTNSDVPPIISDIVMKLMSKNVEDRYQSAFGVKADLEKCLENLFNLKNIGGLDFELAQNDFSGRFQIPQKLYGRESEIDTLLQAFERVANPPFAKGKSELILIAGYSGVGKTALVHEVHKPMTEKCGCFASGKFDQLGRNIPYSALTQAFNAFCNYRLTDRPEQLKQWREKILSAVGNNGQVLIEVIPKLELVIGPQPAAAEVGPTEAQNRFNLVFQNFFRTISQAEHPLILFIDDLQWADSASLNLLETLITDTESQYFLIIGAYRDNEVDATHPLMMMVKDLQKAVTTVNTIQLQNLSVTDVHRLISETFKSEPVHVQPLTQLVYEKTQGNAFFTHEFLKSLYKEELLIFDIKEQKWQWALSKISAKDMTDNVVELMASQIGQLPTETQAVLKLAACIGNKFNLNTLSLIYQQAQPDTFSHLWKAIEEGLIEPQDENYKQVENLEKCETNTHFKFQHDRVQQAAYALIPEMEKSVVHLEIGRLLLANAKTENLEEQIFEMVNQLNGGLALITAETEKVTLARLNLQAGKKAKSGTAYQAAINYLGLGVPLLGECAWDKHCSLTFELHQEQGECEFLLGHFDRSDQLLALAAEKAQSKFDQAEIYVIKIALLAGQGKYHEAVATMIAALNMFDMNVPTLEQTEAQQQATTAEIALYQEQMKDRHIDDLYHLPLMQDEEMKVCSQIIGIAFDSIVIGIPDRLAFYATKMVNMSIKNGLSVYTPVGYAFFAAILSGGFKDYSGTYQFTALALRLNQKKLINSRAKTKIYNVYGFFNVLKEPINICAQNFRETYRIALESGDFSYAGYAMVEIPRYILPLSIEDGLKATRETIAYAKKENYLPSLLLGQLYEGFLKNLQGFTLSRTNFNYGEFTEEIIINAFEKEASLIAIYKRYKLQSFSIFEYYEQALPLVHERALWIAAFGAIDLSLRSDYYLHAGITCAALYSTASEKDKLAYLEILDECLTENQLLSNECQINFEHACLILQAEKAKVENRLMEAIHLYDQAIASAKKYDYLCHEALANELAAKFWLAQQKKDFAPLYLKGAHHAYQQWGATAKVKDLEEKYPQFFTESQPIQKIVASNTSLSTSTQLDLDSVMKASQTLSGEMVLSGLLEKMMHIVIENAGASSGFLLLPQQEQWMIEAQGQVDSTEIKVLQALPLDQSEAVCASIIHYVARTQDNVVLNNATVEGNFTHEACIIKRQSKSVLCAPLLNQGKLTGILYLENHLTEGAFTSERLEVLNLLSSQIAISIENANLYSHLEQKVTERTQELSDALEHLKATQAQLIESEKMASLGGLVAGIAHEINTPLGIGVTAASTLEDTTVITVKDYDNKQLKGSALKAYFQTAIQCNHLILKNLERASELVQTFKQVAVDQSNFEIRTFAVKKYIENALISLTPHLKKTRHKITVNGDEKLEINSYPGGFSQIITHLVMNSLNHAYPEGEAGHIHFDLRCESERLSLEYSDDGCGIPADNLGKIFEPFFTTKRARGGIGLGLHIVYNLVTQLKGSLRVQSEIGIGTTFILDLSRDVG